MRLISYFLTSVSSYLELFANINHNGKRDIYIESGNVYDEQDNTAASLKLSPGCCLEVFDGRDNSGSRTMFCESVSELEDEWKNKISSFIFTCGGMHIFIYLSNA